MATGSSPPAPVSRITNEALLTQNPALGAAVLWRATCGYHAAHQVRAAMALPLAFTIIPVVFTKPLFDVLAHTNRESGLRKYAEKFAGTKEAKQDLLLSLHERCSRWRDISWASLRLAFATRLLTLTPEALLIPLTETPPRGIPAKTTPLLKNAEKLGAWYGSLSIHEISTLLKVRF